MTDGNDRNDREDRMDRRAFLNTAAAGAAALLVGPAALDGAATSVDAGLARAATTDRRLQQLVALTRDITGATHIERAAFLGPDGFPGTLPVSAEEADDLHGVIASGDFSPFQQRGFRVGGTKFVYIRSDRDEVGTTVHGVRRGGEFVTVRTIGGHTIVATSGPDMVHNRAVEALYQYLKPFVTHA